MTTLNLDDLLALHVKVIKFSGGSEGVRDIGRLDSVISTQSQKVFGKELYTSVEEKAAALCRGIIADHPFTDGNKRTAMLAALTFLQLNRVELEFTNQELEDYAVYIATDRPDVAEITNWLERHTKTT